MRRIALTLTVVLGCSGSSGSKTDAGATTGDGAAGDPNVLVGTFLVTLTGPNTASGEAGFTSVLGRVLDGPTPAMLIWETAAMEGGCVLSKPRVPFCSKPCGGNAACVADDVCQPYPMVQNLGTVTVTGLTTEAGDSELPIMPVAGNYQLGPDVKLVFPPFAEGADVVVRTGGGAYAPFMLQAKGIVPMVVPTPAIPVTRGQPLALTWSPPGAAASSKIHVKVDISHHGGTKGMIECDVADTGSLQVPAALVSQLLDLGVSGFPTVVITRKTTGSAVIAPGRVELVVSQYEERAVSVPGVISCIDDAECPSGQTCQKDLQCK